MATTETPIEDQEFAPDEKLFRRVPPTHFENGRATLAGLKATLTFANKKDGDDRNLASPSCVRGKYGTPKDAISPQCAGDKTDVGDFAVVSIKVSDLPKNVETQIKKSFDFYPFYQPLPKCIPHTLIHCCETGSSSPKYDDPTTDAKNRLRADFFQKHIVELLPPPALVAENASGV